MAIQMKRGELAYLDKSRLQSGEIVMATDENYVGIAIAPSNVKEIALKNDVARKGGGIIDIANGCFTFDRGYLPVPIETSYIDIVTMPDKLTYSDGETISIRGISVHAYDGNGNDLGELPLDSLKHTTRASVHTGITANCDPDITGSSNAIISTAGTTISTFSGGRSPVTKLYDGDGAFLIGKNVMGTSWGGNWCEFFGMSDVQSAAIVNMPTQTPGAGKVTINNIDYYISGPASNGSWGGATPSTVTNPLNLPVVSDVQLNAPNSSMSIAQVKYVIRSLNLLWVGGAVTITVVREDGKELNVQYGITVS